MAHLIDSFAYPYHFLNIVNKLVIYENINI